ncbi:unnamed protein product, partial [Symbiodinium microadriaticum]
FLTSAALSLLGIISLSVPFWALHQNKEEDGILRPFRTLFVAAPVILWLAAISCACFDEAFSDRFRCNTRWVCAIMCLILGVALILLAASAIYYYAFAIPSSIDNLDQPLAASASQKQKMHHEVGELLGYLFLDIEEAMAFTAASGLSLLACLFFGTARLLAPVSECREAGVAQE